MRDVVELRVHGVGGGSPEGLLGVDRAETVRVAGAGPTGIWARRAQRSVEGFWWGRLTSAPLLQPLWIMLLPFTLLNVAGWMHEPLEDRTRPTAAWWAVRYALRLIGYLLTALYAAWAGVLVIDLALVQWRGGGRLSALTLFVAFATVVAGMIAVLVTSRRVQQVYEQQRPPQGVVAEARSLDGRALGGSRARSAGERDIAAPSFWLHAPSAAGLLLRHVAVATLVLLIPLGLVADRVGSPVDSLGYDTLVTWLLSVAVVALVVLVGLSAFERWAFARARRRDPGAYVRTTPSGFRVFGQAVAATAGVALAVGAFTGIERLLRDRIDAVGMANQRFDVAFGIAAIVFLGVVLWRGVAHLVAKRRALATLRAGAHDGDSDARGVSAPMLTRVAWARSLSSLLRNIDLVLSVPALSFLAVAVLVVLGVHDALPWAGTIAVIGGWVIAVGMSTILVFLWREGRRTAGRRQVGMIWDVLTFWPRRVHPWGIRPYSERAVPELQQRLCRHVDDGRAVIVSAHSQGTVLAVAALAQLVRIDPAVARHVALVTYGSPITQLYQRFFPAYFHPSMLREVHGALGGGDLPPETTWRNFYRETDYVGKALFAGTDLTPLDQVLDDPSVRPVIDALPLSERVASAPDTIRDAFTALALHSEYNGELELRAWVEQLRAQLGASAARPPAPRGATPPVGTPVRAQ